MMDMPFCEQRVKFLLTSISSVKVAPRPSNRHNKHDLFRDGNTAKHNTTSTLLQPFKSTHNLANLQSSSIFACGPAVSTKGTLSSVTDPRCLIHSFSTRK